MKLSTLFSAYTKAAIELRSSERSKWIALSIRDTQRANECRQLSNKARRLARKLETRIIAKIAEIENADRN